MIKVCSNCENRTSRRIKKCPKCNQLFVPKGGLPVDWQSLGQGDLIRVVVGSGPTYAGKAEPINMGYSGKFRVNCLETHGILAYPIKAKETGACFIYMGTQRKSSTGVMMFPHKIFLLKKGQKT